MDKNLASFSTDKFIFWLTAGFVFLFPLAYLPTTSELTQYPKLVFTIVVAALMLVLWGITIVQERKITFVHTPINTGIWVVGVALLLSSLFSISQSISIFGEFNSWHGTLVEWAAFGTIFCVATTRLTSREFVKLTWAYLFGVFLIALFAITTYFNVWESLPANAWTTLIQIDGFSPAGNTPSTLILLFSGLVICLYWLAQGWKHVDQTVSFALGGMTAAIAVALVLWLSAYMPFLPNRTLPFTQLNFDLSWKVASSTIRDFPWFGTGPSTFVYAYEQYKPVMVNLTTAWSTVFIQSGSEYMHWLTTTGIIGCAALLFFLWQLVQFLKSSYRSVGEKRQLVGDFPFVFVVIAVCIIFLFTASTVTTWGVFFIMLMFWVGYQKGRSQSTVHNITLDSQNMPVGQRTEGSPTGALQGLTSILAVICFITAGLTLYYLQKDFRSNIAYAESVRLLNVDAPVVDVIKKQEQAIKLNKWRDTYHRGHANTTMRLAEVIASSAEGNQLQDAELNDVKSLLQRTVAEVLYITEKLNPSSYVNWRVRASVYQRLIGVETDAEQFAIRSYEAAIDLAPVNPVLRTQLATLYYERAQAIAGSQQEIENKDAIVQNYLAMARNGADLAVQLKPNYVQAHVLLGQIYLLARQDQAALSHLQSALDLLMKDSAEYVEVKKLFDSIQKGTTTQDDADSIDQTTKELEISVSPTPTITR